MAISGIGYSQTYYYNAVTKEFTSKDKDGQSIADYLNTGDEQKKKELTDFEERQKNVLEAFLRIQNSNSYAWNKFKTVEGQQDVYEVTYVKENALESSVLVGGQEVFREMAALCLPETLNGKWDYVFPDKAPFDKKNNSAVIAPGDEFTLKNGYKIAIGKDGAYVKGSSYGKGSMEDDAYAEKMADALTEFLKIANRGCFELTVSMLGDEVTQDVMGIIGQTGVDLSKEFVVNGTRFKEVDNKLSIVGAFAEGSKVWEREAEWKRGAMKELLYDNLGISDEQLEKELSTYSAAIPEKGTGAPYSYLADENGIIEYNGVIFTCNNDKKWLCLGDMSNMDNVIRIPLSEGGCLMVNRDNIGDLGRAIGMFSPADINLILRALKLDAKIQQMKKEIEEMEDGIGKSSEEEYADNTQDAIKEAKENGNAMGFNGYEGDTDKGIFELEEWQLEMLLNGEDNLFQFLSGRREKEWEE